ncbi:hypothetical protein [Bacillus altitudinis]|uniref:hypothetical protein n=1 Tax=Bacillus altitudinis TaxID=293387 RepID=UPI00119D3AEB|nr:hypothetical protein [Bacillus altitudinis]
MRIVVGWFKDENGLCEIYGDVFRNERRGCREMRLKEKLIKWKNRFYGVFVLLREIKKEGCI